MNQRPNHRRVSVSPRYTITAFNVAVAVMVTPHLFELAQGQQQEQACTLCHDGSVPPFLDATPALLEGLTCESFESIRVRESDADSAECATFQSLGLLCGCPVPPGGCPMCHDGSLPSGEQLDQTIPMENFSYTCRELYFAAGASSQNNQDAPTCNQWLMPGVLCGCPVPPTGCKLCADGRSPPNLAFRPEVFAGEISCLDLFLAAANPDPGPGDPSCEDWQYVGSSCCSGSDTSPSCTLCEDGSEPPLPSTQGFTSTFDCAFANEEVSMLLDAGECRSIQGSLGVYCGCNNPLASQGHCRLCGDGKLLPDPSLVAFVDPTVGDVSCLAVESNSEGLDCVLLQTTFAPMCCSGDDVNDISPPSQTASPVGCNLCYDGTVPADLDYIPSLNGGKSCRDMLQEAQETRDPEQCNNWVLLGILCGCPVPPGGCSLCYDASLPPNPSLQLDIFDGASCQQLAMTAADPETAESGVLSCNQWLGVGVFCQCPIPDKVCALCEDGADLPDPQIFLGERSCADLNMLATFEDDDSCRAWQASAGIYCGCQNPKASENYCRICGNDTLLPDPGRIAFEVDDDGPVVCGFLELNPSRTPCAELQAEYGMVCCGEPIQTGDPTRPPSPPVGDPGPPPVATPTATTSAAISKQSMQLILTLIVMNLFI